MQQVRRESAVGERSLSPALDLYPLARPLLHALDPERAHELGLRALELGLVPARPPVVDPVLATTLFGRTLRHPLGLAAGFDKNARVYRRMFGQGFSWVEVGGVTPRPQPGNPRPRVFRLPQERAVINRIGFANDGLDAVSARMRAAGKAADELVGVNLAANADSADPADDFVRLATRLAPLCDFLTLDISCPNTANGKLFLERAPLEDLLGRLRAAFAGPSPASTGAAGAPTFVAKLAPGMSESTVVEIVDVLVTFGIGALIVSNTTSERPAGLRGIARTERGGLSGPPLFAASTRMLADVRALTHGNVPLIGVGGIASGADAYAKIRAGASALQLYTALIYDGPAGIDAIVRDLGERLRADGFDSIGAAIGAA